MAATIIVVDDHEVVRTGICTAIQQAPCGCRVVGQASTVAEARELVARTSPQIAIIDVVLPDGDGIQLCREIRGQHPDTACVLLTSFPEPRNMLSAAFAGAAAYLSKDSSATDLLGIVSAIVAGERFLDPREISVLLDEAASNAEEDVLSSRLTGQERRVFELIGQGLSNRQIAEQLHLTERTVKNYASRILHKLGMERRTEAAVLSARLAERRALREAMRP